MTERQLYAFNRIGHIWLTHPELSKANINVLNRYKIDIGKCKIGPGFDELGKVDLEEEISTAIEMGFMDEMMEHPSEVLEIIRGVSMKNNYNEAKEINRVKGAL